MRVLMAASSGMSEADIARVDKRARAAPLGDLINFPVLQLPNAYGPPDLGDDFREPPHSRRPTPVLSETLIGRTFPENHLAAVRGLRNVTLITVENGSHNLFEADPAYSRSYSPFMRGEPVATQTVTLAPPRFR